MKRVFNSPWMLPGLFVIAGVIIGVLFVQWGMALIFVDIAGQPLGKGRAHDACPRCGHDNPLDDHGIGPERCEKCGGGIRVDCDAAPK